MTRRRFTLEEKYCSAVRRRDRIFHDFNGDRNLIIVGGSEYRKKKDPSLKSIYLIYLKLHRVEKTIKDLEEIIDLTPNQVAPQDQSNSTINRHSNNDTAADFQGGGENSTNNVNNRRCNNDDSSNDEM